MNGILNVNKPRGQTSFDVVRHARRLTGLRRVGHGGTLDPSATGVLLICIGQATRMAEHILSLRKRYVADVRLGVITDTYDAEGKMIGGGDASFVTLSRAEEALARFRGRTAQVPPMYSALKREGVPLYRLARAGVEIKRDAREIEVYSIEITGWESPLLRLELECSSGTYVRSIAHDFGAALGCGAHLQGLIRTAVGPFDVKEAMSVEGLGESGALESCLYPMDSLVLSAPAALLDEETRTAVTQGRLVADGVGRENHAPKPSGPCRAYGPDGEFVAMLAYDESRSGWQPVKVFAPPVR